MVKLAVVSHYRVDKYKRNASAAVVSAEALDKLTYKRRLTRTAQKSGVDCVKLQPYAHEMVGDTA